MRKAKQTQMSGLPWYSCALIALYCTLEAVHHAPTDTPAIAVYFVGVAAIAWLLVLRAFLKERPQWSLRTMLLLGVAVAVLCSISRYVTPREFTRGIMIGALALVQLLTLADACRNYRKPPSLEETPSRPRESLPKGPQTDQCLSQEPPPTA